MSDNEFETALNTLPALARRPTAAAIVRENLALLRRRKRDGVDELALLDHVNRRARSPITLYTLRCYLSRGAGRSDLSYSPVAAPAPEQRATPKAAPSKPPPAHSRVPPQASERQPARTEQRGVIQPVKPGPVE